MGADKEQVIKEIVGAIRRLYRAVYLDSSKTSREFGLTGAQSGVLRMLFSYGPLSSADLSRKLYVTPSNMTGIIDRLEQRDLVERIRRRQDRRVVLITLTEKGKDVSQLLPDPIEKKLIHGLADMNSGQVHALGAAMNEILKLVNAEGMEETPFDVRPDMNQNPDRG